VVNQKPFFIMKKLLVGCLLMAMAMLAVGQKPIEIHPGRVPGARIKPYVVAKAELWGPAMDLARVFSDLADRSGPPQWPAWHVITGELGLGKRSAIFAGIGGRYQRYFWEDNRENHFAKVWVGGFKVIAGYRQYITLGMGQGFYLQPTFKYVWQGHNRVTNHGRRGNEDHDYLGSLRFGWQMPILKRLHLDVAAGPGVGLRSSMYDNGYDWAYFYHRLGGLSELDVLAVYLHGFRDPAWTTLYLTGDASVALGWRF
jgi:hypothetical protein